MEQIQDLLENVKLEGKQSHLNLMIFPSLARDAGETDYLVLEEALSKGGLLFVIASRD